MSVTIVAGSTATFTYTPDVAANGLPAVTVYDPAGDEYTLTNSPVDASEDNDLTLFILTLEASETEDLLGDCRIVWTWNYTDENGTNTVRDTEEFTVVESVSPVVPLTVGADTYATLDEAEDYMNGRLGADAWYAADTGNRSRALLMAARRIDAMPLRGRKYESTQVMEFPRVFWEMGGQSSLYSEEDERYSSITKYAGYTGDGTVPQRVKDAQVEEALVLLEAIASDTDRFALQAQGVTRVRIGDFEEEYSASTRAGAHRVRSAEAIALMRPYTAGSVTIR